MNDAREFVQEDDLLNGFYDIGDRLDDTQRMHDVLAGKNLVLMMGSEKSGKSILGNAIVNGSEKVEKGEDDKLKMKEGAQIVFPQISADGYFVSSALNDETVLIECPTLSLQVNQY